MNDPVIIAGAGPVGLTLAGELRLAGVETVVLERLPEPSGRAPGMAINATVIELLTLRGVMDDLRDDGLALPQAHFAHLGLDTTKVRERDCSIFVVPHSRLTRRLAERAERLGADIRRGHEVAGLAQDENGVVADVRAGGGRYRLTGRYLVGCDGTDSAVRRLAGIGFPGTESPFHGIVGDLAVEPDDELFHHLGPRQFADGLCTVGPAAPGILRVAAGRFGAEPEDGQAPADLEELNELVRRVTGAELKTAGTPLWLDRWWNVTRQAERYRAGAVFVAGDAAHVQFPLGGQALSCGIEDAVNLGWKLAGAVHGWAPPGLLDTYHAERHPAGARACRTTRAQVALMHALDEIGPLRDVIGELIRFDDVNEYLVKQMAGVDIRYPMPYEDGPDATGLLGRRIPDLPLQTPTGPASVAAQLRTGRAVLLDLAPGAPLDVTGWAGRVDVVTAEPTPRIPARAVLIRPDGRVAWAGDGDSDGLRTALRTWFGDGLGQL